VLDPYDRLQLVSELRPPEGFEFDCGIGTTFSLDLESLLTVPLSLALCEFESRQAVQECPEAVLEGLRRIAGKLHVFCHRGRIKRPSEGVPLFSLLEDMVVQALPEHRGAVFHPKVWVLRYRHSDQALIRVLVLSRNLTFDKSWDTAVVLEGMVQPQRAHVVGKNQRLADFILALESLSDDVNAETRASLGSLAEDVMRVQFEVPAGFDDFRFWPMGIGTAMPDGFDGRHSRLMIISPFLSDLSATGRGVPLDQLRMHRSSVTTNVLVSRADQLDALSPDSIAKLEATTRIYVLDDAALNIGEAERLADEALPPASDALSGLHAKVYVIEEGAKVRILTGSANATRAAWADDTGNVEFLVEMSGERRLVGIETLLGVSTSRESGAGGMHRMLRPYTAPAHPEDVDADRERLDRMMEDACREISGAALTVTVSADAGGTFQALLAVPSIELPAGIECLTWPVMLPQGRAQCVQRGAQGRIPFVSLSIHALTPFWAFRVRGKSGKVEQVAEFVIRLPLEGMPETRNAAILSRMIDSPERFLKYLALLLSDDGSVLVPVRATNRARRGAGVAANPLDGYMVMEDLVRAYGRNPERLVRIEALMKDLKQGGTAASPVPPDFEVLWKAFRQGLQ
jgi:hypothetical protein